LTCSHDSTLYYKSILGDFPSSKFDHSKDVKEELESCTVVIDEPLGKDYKITKYLVGTISGQLLLFEPGFWGTNTSTVN
jgi:hypothetical protein